MATENKTMRFDFGGEGKGYFSDNVKVCGDAIAKVTPDVIKAFERVKFDTKTGRPFTMVDYGALDGGTSMPLMSTVIGAIRRKYGDEQEVIICYEDQPTNDFKSLFNRLYGLLPNSPKSILQDHSNVFAVACGTSFYKQCLPSGSVCLGLSFMSLHCLSKKPCSLKKTIAHYNASEEEKKIFADQGRQDWEKLLVLRAKELAIGGQMVITIGHVLDDNEDDCKHVLRTGSTIWRQMADDGLLTQEEFEDSLMCFYGRTTEEVKHPFKCEAGPVCKAGLRLVSTTIVTQPCRFHEEWVASGKTAADVDAAKVFAREKIIKCIRALFTPAFLKALGAGRSADEKNGILDEFYDRFEALIVREPEKHQMVAKMHCIHVEKV